MEPKRLRCPYINLGKKPRLLSCADGVYNRFDFTEPFTCFNDFMRYMPYADTSILPPYFTVQYEDDGGLANLPVVWTLEKSLSSSRDYGSLENSVGQRPANLTAYSGGVYHARLLICDSIQASWSPSYLYEYHLIAAKSITISPSKALEIKSYPVPVSFDRDVLTVSSSAIISESHCGSGGIPTSLVYPPNGTLQGVSGSSASPSGVYLGTGGGGSGGVNMVNAPTSGVYSDPLSGGSGGDGTLWHGGIGGSGYSVTTDQYGGARIEYGSATGGITCCLYAESFNNEGTIGVYAGEAKRLSRLSASASSGRTGGGCLVVHSPNVVNSGAFSVSRGAQVPSPVNAYGGNAGDGSYKVVTM